MNLNLTAKQIDILLNTIDIELSGLCNANCVFCPRERMTRERTVLSPLLFERVLHEINEIHPEGPKAIFFSGLGEPLINKNLCRFAEYANIQFPDAFIILVSNGSLLNRKMCDAILASPIYALSCSMQSIYKERYEAYMPGARFETVMRCLKYLAEKRWETGFQLTVTYVRMDQTDEEIQEYNEFWHSLKVQTAELELHNRGGFLDLAKTAEPCYVKRCLLFEQRLFVAANGDVLACCQDLDGRSKLGTLGIDSLNSILERKKARIVGKRFFQMCEPCNDKNAGKIV
jgi:wyosine [tRNA(Phe)-imidazoG37] synthetase (radical SAM superfamily)